LISDNGDLVIDQEEIVRVAQNHFRQLFLDDGEWRPWDMPNMFPVLEGDILKYVHNLFFGEEIKMGVFCMGLFKAPGLTVFILFSYRLIGIWWASLCVK